MKPGYKQTEVGVIPDDWNVSRIGQLASTSSGTTPPRAMAERYFHNGTIPWVKTLDLNNSTLESVDEMVTPHALAETSLNVYPAGSVLVAMYGGYNQIGRTGLLKSPATVNQALTAIRPDPKKLNSGYLLRVLNHRVEYWKSVASSSRKDPNITGKDVQDFPLAIPPIAEQEAIAEALSEADTLIESLAQLLAKKRDLKQGAMQDLLTGKSRLPGFSDEWRTKQLADICQMKSGASITSESIDAFSNFPCYGGNGLRGFTSEHTHDGTFALIGRQGALCGNVIVVSGKFFASEHAIVVTPTKGTDVNWLALVLARMNLNQYAESSAQPGLSVSKLQSFTCVAPSFDEQTAIADIVSAMDVEIACLESKLTKACQLKQGMMQELLTGHIRLI